MYHSPERAACEIITHDGTDRGEKVPWHSTRVSERAFSPALCLHNNHHPARAVFWQVHQINIWHDFHFLFRSETWGRHNPSIIYPLEKKWVWQGEERHTKGEKKGGRVTARKRTNSLSEKRERERQQSRVGQTDKRVERDQGALSKTSESYGLYPGLHYDERDSSQTNLNTT